MLFWLKGGLQRLAFETIIESQTYSQSGIVFNNGKNMGTAMLKMQIIENEYFMKNKNTHFRL